ncbi:MAG: NADH:ubiquinone reductase (Na(+)-transporting) subunit B [Planctomycetota bacterium]
MKLLRNLVDSGRKLYHEPGSKLHGVWPLLDAFETFLFTPSTPTGKSGPHVRDYIDLKRTMWTVIVALVPCLLWSFYNNGYQHFLAISQFVANGGANPYLAQGEVGAAIAPQIGWLQWVIFGSSYAPDVAAPGFGDILVFGLQQMLPILFVSYFVGLNIEGLFAVLRKEEISEGYLVTGILIALIVPASVPLWQLALAVAFAVVLAKEVFGGTGTNIFNVALIARAFLFFAYPAQMSGDFVWVAGNGSQNLIDGYSGPTALAAAAQTKLEANHLASEGIPDLVGSAAEAVEAAGYTFWDLFIGLVPGSAGETSALCALIGALVLVVTGVGSWRTMVAGVIGLVSASLLMMVTAGGLDGIGGLPPHYHLVMGGFAFGIVFMATDPVSSPETDRSKWIYGFLIGVTTVLVRAVNPAYPEGVMLAILLLNAFAPTIDHFVIAANIRRRKARFG